MVKFQLITKDSFVFQQIYILKKKVNHNWIKVQLVLTYRTEALASMMFEEMHIKKSIPTLHICMKK